MVHRVIWKEIATEIHKKHKEKRDTFYIPFFYVQLIFNNRTEVNNLVVAVDCHFFFPRY